MGTVIYHKDFRNCVSDIHLTFFLDGQVSENTMTQWVVSSVFALDAEELWFQCIEKNLAEAKL